VLCTLGLTVIPDWRSTWRAMLSLVRPGGRIAVMDAGYSARPGQAGEMVALRPAAWLANSSPPTRDASPERSPTPTTNNPTTERYTWGYIGVAAGTSLASPWPKGSSRPCT
jgi:hypothetical protein